MTTLKDISRHLNISVTQVSRAINGYSDVGPETRKRVEEAAKQLNYIPNRSARKLASGRSGIVALVQPDHPDLIEDNGFVETVTNLSREFSKREKQFVLHIASTDDDILDVYSRLIGGGAVDGFVVQEPRDHDERIPFLTDRNLPFVVHGRTLTELNYPFFDIDNYDVGYQLTRFLVELGHKRIAHINGRRGYTYATLRERGYRDALKEAGLPVDENIVRNARMTEEMGLIKSLEIMQISDDPPTAFVASHVRVAKGIYKTMEALGLSIPDDVSVVAHDDVLPKLRPSAFYPALTVTKNGFLNSWAPLAEYLNNIFEGASVEANQKIQKAEFLSRASHRKLP